LARAATLVGEAVRIGADRANEARGGAFALRNRRAAAALGDSGAVTGAILRARHPLIDEDDAPSDGAVGRGFEFGHAGKAHDLGFEATFRRRRRAAEGGNDKTLLRGRDNARLLARRIPIRDGEVFDANVAEALFAQHAHSPITGARFGFGAGETRTDFGDQAFDDVPRIVARERRRAQALNRAQLRGAEFGDGRRRRRIGGDDKTRRLLWLLLRARRKGERCRA